MLADPASARWITGAVRDEGRGSAVGRAGFTARRTPPGWWRSGTRSTRPRRLGYARAALEILLDRAAAEPSVRTVRASISPGNVASRDLVLQHGFVEVGEQEDDEDGREIVYEVVAQAATRSARRASSLRRSTPAPPRAAATRAPATTESSE